MKRKDFERLPNGTKLRVKSWAATRIARPRDCDHSFSAGYMRGVSKSSWPTGKIASKIDNEDAQVINDPKYYIPYYALEAL